MYIRCWFPQKNASYSHIFPLLKQILDLGILLCCLHILFGTTFLIMWSMYMINSHLLTWLTLPSASSMSSTSLAQPLSDQIWVNRAFCGKNTKFGTHVHDTKKSKFSYSAKPDFPCGGCGSHLKKWPLCHHIAETTRRRAIIVDYI